MTANDSQEIADLSQRIRKAVVLAYTRRKNTHSLPVVVPEIFENESVWDYERRLVPLLEPNHRAKEPKPQIAPKTGLQRILDKVKELFKRGLGFQ